MSEININGKKFWVDYDEWVALKKFYNGERMGNKYYTPTLEEFHVGFECETLDRCDWIKSEIVILDPIQPYHKQITKKIIRVKYLDREDIESLGFKFKESAKSLNDTSSHFFDIYTLANDIQLSHYNWYTGSSDTDYIEHRGVRIIYLPDNVDMVMFRGNIKNKSELVKLLKQLGIK